MLPRTPIWMHRIQWRAIYFLPHPPGQGPRAAGREHPPTPVLRAVDVGPDLQPSPRGRDRDLRPADVASGASLLDRDKLATPVAQVLLRDRRCSRVMPIRFPPPAVPRFFNEGD
jgi:hypothetical protein